MWPPAGVDGHGGTALKPSDTELRVLAICERQRADCRDQKIRHDGAGAALLTLLGCYRSAAVSLDYGAVESGLDNGKSDGSA